MVFKHDWNHDLNTGPDAQTVITAIATDTTSALDEWPIRRLAAAVEAAATLLHAFDALDAADVFLDS